MNDDHALHKIAIKQGILLNLPPNVRFIDFDDGSGKGTGPFSGTNE